MPMELQAAREVSRWSRMDRSSEGMAKDYPQCDVGLVWPSRRSRAPLTRSELPARRLFAQNPAEEKHQLRRSHGHVDSGRISRARTRARAQTRGARGGESLESGKELNGLKGERLHGGARMLGCTFESRRLEAESTTALWPWYASNRPGILKDNATDNDKN
jgi:hypothetical protein